MHDVCSFQLTTRVQCSGFGSLRADSKPEASRPKYTSSSHQAIWERSNLNYQLLRTDVLRVGDSSLSLPEREEGIYEACPLVRIGLNLVSCRGACSPRKQNTPTPIKTRYCQWIDTSVQVGHSQKNSVSIDRILKTMRLLASVTNASRGNIMTAPVSGSDHSPVVRGCLGSCTHR